MQSNICGTRPERFLQEIPARLPQARREKTTESTEGKGRRDDHTLRHLTQRSSTTSRVFTHGNPIAKLSLRDVPLSGRYLSPRWRKEEHDHTIQSCFQQSTANSYLVGHECIGRCWLLECFTILNLSRSISWPNPSNPNQRHQTRRSRFSSYTATPARAALEQKAPGSLSGLVSSALGRPPRPKPWNRSVSMEICIRGSVCFHSVEACEE